MPESVTEAGNRWLGRRVQVYAGWDHHKQHGPIAEGVVVGYAPHPTICIRSADGRQSDWQVTLPITVLEEEAEIPAGSAFVNRPERLARWLHSEFGGPFKWEESPDYEKARYWAAARKMLSQLPEMFG